MFFFYTLQIIIIRYRVKTLSPSLETFTNEPKKRDFVRNRGKKKIRASFIEAKKVWQWVDTDIDKNIVKEK